MTTPDDLNDRMTQLRDHWPVGSIVDNVMARITPPAIRRVNRLPRLFAGLAASGMVAALALAWIMIASRPTTLLAAVKDSLKKANSAHIVVKGTNDKNVTHTFEIWYRRDLGLRAELLDQVIVEDGKTQWKWDTGAGETVVFRQNSPGFFMSSLPEMMGLSEENPNIWTRVRSPERDRDVNGHACQATVMTLDPKVKPAGSPEVRAFVLAEPEGRIHVIKVEQAKPDGTWRPQHEVSLEYDVPIDPARVAIHLPAGARIVDRNQAFTSLYPLEKALHQVERGGLILAVHDLQPLKDREGFYVVSSVRGTPEFLKTYPPRRRRFNLDYTAIDVAFQPMSNMMLGSKYDRIAVGNIEREGIEFSWWLIVPRKFFEIKDGKRVYSPENDLSAMPGEPGRLDDLTGKARVLLSATYWDDKHRDDKGVTQGVSAWVEVPIPADRPAAPLETVAARARRDALAMGLNGWPILMGIAADAKSEPQNLRPMVHFDPEKINDADFASAVRRGLDDMRSFDETHQLGPDDFLPGRAGNVPKP